MSNLDAYIEGGFTIREAQPTPPAGPKLLRQLSGDVLMSRTFDPINMLVDNLIVEGLTFLIAPPKYRKSWMMLDLAVSVSNGAPFLGRQTKPSSVLYLAFEDSERRLHDRLAKMRQPVGPRFLYATGDDVITIPGGLVNALEAYLDKTPGIGVVIVDTLASIRGDVPGGSNVYQQDYNVVNMLKQFADAHHIAVILVHHTRKASQKDADFFDRINGSTGLTGAADTVLFLDAKRGEDDAILHVESRDFPSTSIELFFADFRWHVYAPGELLRLQYEAAPPVKTLKAALGGQVTAHFTYEYLKQIAIENGTYIGSTTQDIHKGFSAWADDLARRDGIFIVHKKQAGGKFGLDVTVIAPKGSR